MREGWPQADDERRLIRRRFRRSFRFKCYCVTAIAIACAFLGYFLFDLVYRAYPAFWQAKVHTTLKYTPASVQNERLAVSEAKRSIVSKGVLRTIPLRVTRNPRAEVKVAIDQDADPSSPLDAARPAAEAGDLTRERLRSLLGPEAGDELEAALRGEEALVIRDESRTPGVRWVRASDEVNRYLAQFQAVTKVSDVAGYYATPTVSGTVLWDADHQLPTDARLRFRLLELHPAHDQPVELASQTVARPMPFGTNPGESIPPQALATEADFELEYELSDIELGRVYVVHAMALVDGEVTQEAVVDVLTDSQRQSSYIEGLELTPVEGDGVDFSAWAAMAPEQPPVPFARQRTLRELYLNGALRRRYNDLIHTQQTRWVLATSDVDQFMQLPESTLDQLRELPEKQNTLQRVREDLSAARDKLAAARGELDALEGPTDAQSPDEQRRSLEPRIDRLKQKVNRLSSREAELAPRVARLKNLTRLSASQRAQVFELLEAGELERHFNVGFFTNGDSALPEQAGIFSATVGTLLVLVLVLVLSFPVGVLTAIYLEEFAPDNWFTQMIEVNINNLAAVPSILFGLLGLAVFIAGGKYLFDINIRSTALVAGLTLSLMTLPIIIISSRAALRAVPESIRLGAMAMGATRWQTVCHHVLPQSISGILTGTIIGLAQAIGETAPLIIVGLTAFNPSTATGLMEETTVLPAQIYLWFTKSQNAYQELTAAGILVLLAVLLTMNATAVLLRARFEKRW